MISHVTTPTAVYLQVNVILNAVTDQRFEAALQDARQIDRQIAEGLSDDYFKARPFLGGFLSIVDTYLGIYRCNQKLTAFLTTDTCFQIDI